MVSVYLPYLQATTVEDHTSIKSSVKLGGKGDIRGETLHVSSSSDHWRGCNKDIDGLPASKTCNKHVRSSIFWSTVQNNQSSRVKIQFALVKCKTLLEYIIINRYKVQFRQGNLKRSESDVDPAPSSHLGAKKRVKNKVYTTGTSLPQGTAFGDKWEIMTSHKAPREWEWQLSLMGSMQGCPLQRWDAKGPKDLVQAYWLPLISYHF